MGRFISSAPGRLGTDLGSVPGFLLCSFRNAMNGALCLPLTTTNSLGEYYRLATLAALSASHHHKVGKADMPYFGSGSGWPNRSQRAVRNLL